MHTLTMDDLTMRELTAGEIEQVSGGWTTRGAAWTLAGTLIGIAGIVVGTIGAPVWAVVAGAVGIGAAAVMGLAYAYDAGTEIQQHLPQGTVTIEELIPVSGTDSQSLQTTISSLGTSSTVAAAETVAENDMGYISYVDNFDFGGIN